MSNNCSLKGGCVIGDIGYCMFLACAAIRCETDPERKAKAKKLKSLLIKYRDLEEVITKLLNELIEEDK